MCDPAAGAWLQPLQWLSPAQPLHPDRCPSRQAGGAARECWAALALWQRDDCSLPLPLVEHLQWMVGSLLFSACHRLHAAQPVSAGQATTRGAWSRLVCCSRCRPVPSPPDQADLAAHRATSAALTWPVLISHSSFLLSIALLPELGLAARRSAHKGVQTFLALVPPHLPSHTAAVSRTNTLPAEQALSRPICC